jgi:DNA-damage-inducible protein J
MPASTEMIHVRLDRETKQQATEALAHMGLSVSDAVRMFLHRVAADQAFPLELKVPNAETRAAMLEARTIAKARFAKAEELFDELEG